MNYSDPYRQRIPRPVIKKIIKWTWDWRQALRIGGPIIGIGIAQLLLILAIDVPKHDCRTPFVRMVLALILFLIPACFGIRRKIIDKTILE